MIQGHPVFRCESTAGVVATANAAVVDRVRVWVRSYALEFAPGVVAVLLVPTVFPVPRQANYAVPWVIRRSETKGQQGGHWPHELIG